MSENGDEMKNSWKVCEIFAESCRRLLEEIPRLFFSLSIEIKIRESPTETTTLLDIFSEKKNRAWIGRRISGEKKGIRWLWDTLYTHPPPFPRSTPMSSPLSDYWSGCSTGAALLLNVIWLLPFLHSYDMQQMWRFAFVYTCIGCNYVILQVNK